MKTNHPLNGARIQLYGNATALPHNREKTDTVGPPCPQIWSRRILRPLSAMNRRESKPNQS